jgi:putative addiction module killer protein
MIIELVEVKIYQDKLAKQPFIEWLESLKDLRAIAKIQARIARLRLGNYGDYKSLGQELYELRIDEGGGYRVYFAQESKQVIILLMAGSKKTQVKDIKKARIYLQDYRSQL